MNKKKQWATILLYLYLLPLVCIILNYNNIEYDKYEIDENTSVLEHWEDGTGILIIEGHSSTITKHGKGVLVDVFDSQNKLIVKFYFENNTENVLYDGDYELINKKIFGKNQVKVVSFYANSINNVKLDVITGELPTTYIWIDTWVFYIMIFEWFVLGFFYYGVLYFWYRKSNEKGDVKYS